MDQITKPYSKDQKNRFDSTLLLLQRETDFSDSTAKEHSV